MPILNYTTSIEVSKTTGEIQRALARRGVTRISTMYDQDGEPAGLGFTMKTDYGPRDFELPVRVAGVLAALQASQDSGEFSRLNIRPNVVRGYLTTAHAARVAWRIAQDWLEAQSALIDAQLATLDEVMMPYMVTGDGRTMYDVYQSTQKALTS